MNDSTKMKGVLQQHEEWLERQGEKVSKPEQMPELTSTPMNNFMQLSPQAKEQFDKAIKAHYNVEVFSSENGTVYKSYTETPPKGTAGISIEGETYYSSVTELQALQDFLNLRVQEDKIAEIKFKKHFTPIKKSRNKMLHLTPKKKKRK